MLQSATTSPVEELRAQLAALVSDDPTLLSATEQTERLMALAALRAILEHLVVRAIIHDDYVQLAAQRGATRHTQNSLPSGSRNTT